MATGHSREDLLSFLDRQIEAGAVPINTAISRRSSVGRVLEQLSNEESFDVTALDVDDVMKKFRARTHQNYNIATIMSYKSRLQSALQDFSAWLSGSVIETVGQSRRRTRAATPSPTVVSDAADAGSLAILIRKNWAVRVANLPHDLTQAEAQRVANALLAYVYPDGNAA